MVNRSTTAKHSPAKESARLFRVIGVGVDAVLVRGGIDAAGGALIFVSLYNALRERVYDAVMRVMGASRAVIFSMMLEGLC